MAVAALFSVSFPWVLWVLGPVWRQKGWEEPSWSSRISCGDCWTGQWVCREHLHTACSFLPRYQVCLLCSQSPLDGPFPCGSMPVRMFVPDGWVLWAFPSQWALKTAGEHFHAHTKARISLGQWENNDWVVLGKNQDWLTDWSNPLIRVNWTLIYLLAMSK